VPSRSKWRWRMAEKIFLSKWNLGSLGLCILLLMAFGLKGIVSFIAGVGMLSTFVIFGIRLLLAEDEKSKSRLAKLGKETREELQHELEQEFEREIDVLAEQLVHDNDHRTQAALQKLRRLMKDLKKDDVWENVNESSSFRLMGIVDQLYKLSIEKLRRQLKIHNSMAAMETSEALSALTEEREHIILEVEANVAKLAATIGKIAGFKRVSTESQAGQLWSELDDELEIAARANARVRHSQPDPTYVAPNIDLTAPPQETIDYDPLQDVNGIYDDPNSWENS